ncbi:MAG: hypothetical protein M3R05_06290 [Chloroflexota bacterium]|nr:hypothetical protein [Chloroflexota bacterium]
MARAAAPASTVERLAHYLFDGVRGDSIAEEIAGWLAGSARFRAFAEAHRDKIRKKLRSATDAEAQRDVRAELRAAHLLLADRRIELAFEAYGSRRIGPDFTVTFRGERSFNLEVTRQRRVPDTPGYGGPLLAKLRQMPPSVPNALLIAIDGDSAEALDVAAVTRGLRARADAKEDAFFAARGFEGTRAFHQRYQRLGGVLVWCEGAVGDARARVWINPAARIALPERAIRACLLALQAG